MKKGKIFRTLAIAGTCLCAPLLLSGCTSGNENKTDFRVQDGWVQYTNDGTTWINLVEAEYPISEYNFRIYNGYVQWTTDGINWTNLIKSQETYTISLDYGVSKDLFYSNSPYSLSVESNEWVTNLPKIKEEYKDVFLGWFIPETDKQVKEFDFIGGDTVLEARFNTQLASTPAGVYENGKYIKSWINLIEDGNIETEGCTITEIHLTPDYNLVIDKSITEINCNVALSGITIPNTVTSIDCFFNLQYLKSIVVEEGNNVYHSKNNCLIETKNKKLIQGCSTSIIPEDGSVTIIDDSAFFGAVNLLTINIPSTVTKIGRQAFTDCYNLKSIVIPKSIEEIGINPFESCYNLRKIVVEDGNAKYDSRNNCNAIIETTTNTLVAGCQSTTIPSGVTKIGFNAFDGCRNLTEIIIPNTVANIGSFAFCGTGISSIVIPESVTEISDNAFLYCKNLTEITFEEKLNYKWLVRDGVNASPRDVGQNESLFELAKQGYNLLRVAE